MFLDLFDIILLVGCKQKLFGKKKTLYPNWILHACPVIRSLSRKEETTVKVLIFFARINPAGPIPSCGHL
jgi:hypothetical protein